MKKYYKVVSINGNKYFGSYIKDEDDPNRIEYKLNKPSKSVNNTPIFIFDTIENAKFYAVLYTNRIFECTAKNVREPYKKIAGMNIWVHHYWDTVQSAVKHKKSANNYIQNRLPTLVIEPPKGTLWADKITLTKQIQ